MHINAQSSVYFAFPDSNAFWNIQSQSCCVSDCPLPPNPVVIDYNYSYFLRGDTVINSYTYHKVYKSAGNAHEHCLYGNFLNNWWTLTEAYSGAFRQDTLLKQVYFIERGSSQECLLYDFSLQVGDTLFSNCVNWGVTNIVSSIDSVLVGNSFRKRINFSSTNYSIIEGIGSTAGLIEPMFPFEYFGNLSCFSHGGQTIFPDTNISCDINTKVFEIVDKSKLLVYPNPFNTKTTFIASNDLDNSELVIFDSFGKIVRRSFILNNVMVIDRVGLSNGIYFFKLISKQGKSITGTMVID